MMTGFEFQLAGENGADGHAQRRCPGVARQVTKHAAAQRIERSSDIEKIEAIHADGKALVKFEPTRTFKEQLPAVEEDAVDAAHLGAAMTLANELAGWDGCGFEFGEVDHGGLVR